ncbi:hypothetical protein VBY74_01570 [Tenacibaculum ascidiaceicola]|uniref:hypothetical protein n=1 Tax=Tenacibaculum ascidiaceicola TaxID=1699411 RepID=UPI0039E892A4
MKQQFYNLDASIEFSIFNTLNEDLLNIENPMHLNRSSFKVFYEINGKKTEVNNPNLDYPKGFKIYKHVNEYRIRIFLNYSKTENIPTTYIQWDDNKTDTIKTFYQKSQNSILQDIIWLNGEKIWKRTNNNSKPHFVLIK